MFTEKNSIQKWDYEESVKKVRPMVIKWKTLTVEIVDELYRAKKALIASGRSWMSLDVPNGTPKTWGEYLDDVGLAKSTVHRWLERYIPEEQKLLTPEELEERKQIETRRKQDETIAIQQRIKERKKTGKVPDDWDDKTEIEYQKTIREEEERNRRAAETKERLEAETENKQKYKREEDEDYERLKQEAKMLDDAAERSIESYQKRKAFKERIKVSQSGESDVFIDALMDYLEELEDDNRRIEACQNIIKVCRNLSAELQRSK